ncbi:PD-(D/E)XK nuclease family protein [Flavobacterium sp. NRK F10]|uniref:PD-(D/E)XK nuclease family protein n=1 Tax=Flavobacterium sp. NRK F10 TaxID=2954931 RepID=UPI0020903DE8|nr:PD-(D/E)XK nuclease family protein [Flavobacterium sp. NRK F10]MCO6174594.1 PD-(D/E)XK nuclease family protein [Flavobacterium sp. NRK F10]
MMAKTFLQTLSGKILADYEDDLSRAVIVLPNKRARVFLLDILREEWSETNFAPKIASIEELIQEISGIRSVDSIELLFEFYDVYLSMTEKEDQQSFDVFSGWAKIAIQDFNEIDRYLIEPTYIFSYLSDIEALKRWKLEHNDTTELIDKHLAFWKKLPQYYEQLYKHLKERGVGYQGLIYREAVRKLPAFSSEKANYVFAGFNALNASEEKIILHFITNGLGKVYWDIDNYFLENVHHDAGLFIRRFKKNWKPYLASDSFDWAFNHFSEEKNIKIIGTPKSVGQARIAGKLVSDLTEDGHTLDKTALVLGDENLLLPVLNSLPKKVDSLNITMGYPSKNNPAQLLIAKIIKLHVNALTRNEQHYTLYYKEVLEVLNHPFIEPFGNFHELVQIINFNNFTFFSLETLFRLKNEVAFVNEALFTTLFSRWDGMSVIQILESLKGITIMLRDFLRSEGEDEKVSQAFVYSVYKMLNKMIVYQEKYEKMISVKDIQATYKQIVDLAEVSFEGEPLTGLQVMGVLESRVLDFENVIITSVNEGKFPSGKSQQSFIPYDVKQEIGLPTYKEKDAIYSYHFYHLLFRAKNIFLLYNTDSEGIDAGEKSRFITQLEIEKLPKHHMQQLIYNAVLPDKPYEKIRIEKSELALDRLQEIAIGKGFSPSSLTAYIRNPIRFYFQRVLGIRESDEVEENIAVNTLGTIVHESLEQLYQPFVGDFLSLQSIALMTSQLDDVVLQKFKEVYKEGEIKKGKNFLAFEVAKRNVYNFLQLEKNRIESGETIKILMLETELRGELEHARLPYTVKISGKVDRIELCDGKLRIVDYKTGKVEARNLRIKSFEGMTEDLKNEKSIQLLCYALMYVQQFGFPKEEIEAGIISFKNLKGGFMPFAYDKETYITLEIVELFKEELAFLIAQILNPDLAFEEQWV